MTGRNVPARLPAAEQAVYWMVEAATVCYMLLCLCRASEAAWRQNDPIKLEEGWGVIGRPRDVADFEWQFWSTFFWNILPYVCGHVALSATLTSTNVPRKTKQAMLTVYSVSALCHLLGVYTMGLFCFQSLVLFLVSKLESTKAVWLTTLIFLTILNYSENSDVVLWLHSHNRSEDFTSWYYLCVLVWANLCQRATAFALESVWVRQSRRQQQSTESTEQTEPLPESSDSDPCQEKGVVGWATVSEVPDCFDMAFYVFYLPLFFTGPLIVYSDFHLQSQHPFPWTVARLKDVASRLVRTLLWGVLNTLALHFIYAHAINEMSSLLAQQSRWTVAAVGYVLGQFFMTKYLVLFGFPAQLARLDGFEPPAVPACISYIYCYSDMWKCFDRGLYHFMKRYIFIPVGGSRAGLFRQVMGSVLCFAFVFYWHGAEYHLFLWCVVNFMETSLEQIGGYLERTSVMRASLYDRLSPAGKRRVRAAMSVPVFLMSVFAIFYFFGGTESGIVFLRKLLLDIPWSSFGVFLLLVYCAVQNAMEIERLGWAKLKSAAQNDNVS